MNGVTNGVNGHGANGDIKGRGRYSDLPPVIDVPVGSEGEAVEVDLVELPDDPTELCTLLEAENVDKFFWVTVALSYSKQRRVDTAIEILKMAMDALDKGKNDERLSLLNCLCWMYLWKSRDAPRSGMSPSVELNLQLMTTKGQPSSEGQTRDDYLHSATTALNDASRISPSYPPLFLARGVIYLLRAASQPTSNAKPGAQENSERQSNYKQAAKCFEDALRASNGKNLMAIMGRARLRYALGKYAEALVDYQSVLQRAPDLLDPDPRIGIGCCFWQLGHKDDAKSAWERSLHLVCHLRLTVQS